MNKKQLLEIALNYPERPGFILQAHHVQQELTSLFDLPVRLENQKDGLFTVAKNDKTVYECHPKNTSEVDLQKIITAVSKYHKPVPREQVPQTEADDSNDPEYRKWMNCVCSGE